jgi:hypothetical protein
MEILIYNYVGKFAENKDKAKEIRLNEILPSLDRGEEVILDFDKVNSATQSFIHALVSDLIRKKGLNVLNRIYFKNCNTTIQKIIGIVIEYMQDHN